MHGIGYYRIPVFAGMVVVIRRCTRHHAGLDPASIGFLLSQEWYGGFLLLQEWKQRLHGKLMSFAITYKSMRLPCGRPELRFAIMVE